MNRLYKKSEPAPHGNPLVKGKESITFSVLAKSFQGALLKGRRGKVNSLNNVLQVWENWTNHLKKKNPWIAFMWSLWGPERGGQNITVVICLCAATQTHLAEKNKNSQWSLPWGTQTLGVHYLVTSGGAGWGQGLRKSPGDGFLSEIKCFFLQSAVNILRRTS